MFPLDSIFSSVLGGLIVSLFALLVGWLSTPLRTIIRYSTERFRIDVDKKMLPAVWSVSLVDRSLSIHIPRVEKNCLRDLGILLGPEPNVRFDIKLLNPSKNFTEIAGTEIAIRLVSIETTSPRGQKKGRKDPPEMFVNLDIRKPR